MSHTFHEHRHELHGITVVVDTAGGATFVGRFDSEDERGIHLLDVSRFDVGQGGTREEYLRRSARYGIRVEQKHLVVPSPDVAQVSRLGELAI